MREWPLFLIVLVVPFIVRLHIYDVPDALVIRTGRVPGHYADLFGYWKEVAFVTLTGFALIAACWARVVERRRTSIDRIVWMATLAWFVCLLVSAARAPYPELAWLGFFTVFQGALAWAAFFAIPFAACATMTNENAYRRLTLVILLAGSVMAILTLAEALGRPFFTLPPWQGLYASPELRQRGFTLLQTLPSMAAGTLGNSNYTGSFLTMIVPLALACVLRGSRRLATIGVVVVMLAGAALFLARSRGSFLGTGVGIGLVLVLGRANLLARWSALLLSTILALGLSQLACSMQRPLVASSGQTVERPRMSSISELLDQEIHRSVTGGIDQISSGRFDIWSKAIPLLANAPLFGRGPGAFPLDFPNDDPRHPVDRPSNMALSWIHAIGGVSFLIFLALFTIHLRRATSDAWRRHGSTPTAVASLGLLGAVVAFVCNGLTTDCLVQNGPLFWVCFGAGLALHARRVATTF